MHHLLPLLLGLPCALAALAILFLEFRNGLRYGQGTTDIGCMPGPCGCLLVVLGAALGASVIPLGLPAWASVSGGLTALWILHMVTWRLGRALGCSLSPSLERARSTDADARRLAIERLSERSGSRSDRRVRDAVLSGLDSDDAHLYQASVLGGHKLGATPVVLESLHRRLLAGGGGVSMARLSSDIGAPFVELLASLLERHEGPDHIRSEALQVLASLGDRRAVAHILAGFGDSRETVRGGALRAAQWNVQPTYRDPVLAGSCDPSALIRVGSIPALVSLGRAALADPFVVLAPLLSDVEPLVRAEAAVGFSSLGDSRAQALLVPLLQDGAAQVRVSAAQALNHLGWTPVRSEDRVLRAAALARWDDLLQDPEAAAGALLRVAGDATHGEAIVATMLKLLRRHASVVPTADLDRLSVLAGVEQSQFKDMGYPNPVDCSEVHRLAGLELARRKGTTP